MFDVLGKLKEIQENYDNEDMQAAVKAAQTQVVEDLDLNHQLEAGTYQHNEENMTVRVNPDKSVSFIEPQEYSIADDQEYLEYAQSMLEDKDNWTKVSAETVEEDGVEEVHEEDDSAEDVAESEELDRLLKMAGQSGVIGMAKPSVIVSESVEVAEDEVSEEAFVAKEPELEEEEAVEEEAVEETVEVPVSAIKELMKLAGYENYAAEEYVNEPAEEFGSVEDQMALAGGLNGPKDMHIAASDGDNAMAINPVKVKEDDKLTFEGMYKRYMDQVVVETLDNEEE
jgi:hypothetical protein